ncbi:MAG: hypothetical protein R3B54_02430 [Bdellovibrionota bacterium]
MRQLASILFAAVFSVTSLSQAAACFGYQSTQGPCVKGATVVERDDRFYVFGHSKCQSGTRLPGSFAPVESQCEAIQYAAVYDADRKFIATLPKANAPSARYKPLAVNTKSGIFLWGGLISEKHGMLSSDRPASGGAYFDVAKNEWREMNLLGAPPNESATYIIWRGANTYYKTNSEFELGSVGDTVSVRFARRFSRSQTGDPCEFQYDVALNRWEMIRGWKETGFTYTGEELILPAPSEPEAKSFYLVYVPSGFKVDKLTIKASTAETFNAEITLPGGKAFTISARNSLYGFKYENLKSLLEEVSGKDAGGTWKVRLFSAKDRIKLGKPTIPGYIAFTLYEHLDD